MVFSWNVSKLVSKISKIGQNVRGVDKEINVKHSLWRHEKCDIVMLCNLECLQSCCLSLFPYHIFEKCIQYGCWKRTKPVHPSESGRFMVRSDIVNIIPAKKHFVQYFTVDLILWLIQEALELMVSCQF